MRAVRYDDYGDPSVLHVGEVPDPPMPRDGEVRIAVRAAGVNVWDVKVRSGSMAAFVRSRFPVVPGQEAAGVVDAVGEGVTGVSIGDEVLGLGRSTTAEYALLRDVAIRPPTLGWEYAAAIPTAAETAARGLATLGVDAGQTLVVTGASGAVGSFAVQLAVARGARVIGVASPARQAFVESLGASPVAHGDGLGDRVREIAPGGVDRAFDASGHGEVDDLIAVTGAPDRVLTIADFAAAELGVQVSDGSTDRAPEAIGEVARLAAEGRFVVRLGAVLPWTDAAHAHELVESGHSGGRVVLTVPEPGEPG